MLMILMIILLFSSYFIVRSEAQGIEDDVDNVTIPDICHEPHEHIRVNFFWPV